MPAETSDGSSTPSQMPFSGWYLVDTNINSYTGLATDYLNHFNEAIMLLEMLPEMPECMDDLLAWEPASYCEHFITAKFKDRDLAIAAYDCADPARRQRLDSVAKTMNEILLATRDVLRQELHGATGAKIANLAVRWLKPLVARAGAIINGTDVGQSSSSSATAPQAAVDELMAR
jgi:hypothetical protein